MNIAENPFRMLKATPRDRKARIVEIVDEISLHGDQEAAATARNALANLRSRLAAEVAWFPGMDPAVVESCLEQIGRDQAPSVDGMTAICRANLLAESLPIRARAGADGLRLAIEELARTVDAFDPDEVMRAINDDRQASGMPPVSERAQVEEELVARCRYYQGIITQRLDDLASDVMVQTYVRLISDNSQGGTAATPRLINDLIDAYELHAGQHLKDEAAKIVLLIEATQQDSDRTQLGIDIRRSVLSIIEAMRGWDRVAQPIQVARKSRGLDHDDSKNLAFRARDLALHLFNKHGRLEDSTLLSKALQDLFSEVTVVSDRIQEDVAALGNIEKSRQEQALRKEKEQAEFAREITYETSFGLVFKDKFRISPDGLDYKGRLTPLASVTGASWGMVKHYTNGIPTGTTYHYKYIIAGGSIDITPNEGQYKLIVAKSWRAVCVPILLRMMEVWKKGGKIRVGDLEVSDDGLMLGKSRLFRSKEQKLFAWRDMTKGAGNGSLCFYGKNDKKFKAVLSYKDTPNVHIFDFAIGKIWEGKAAKLSGIFGG